jgi:hypothetical protein
MPTATPDTFGAALVSLVRAAADQAEQSPQVLQEVFAKAEQAVGDAADDAKQLPNDVLNSLKQAVDPPDWWSLLAFVLVKLSELDPDHLSVGFMSLAGWSRLLTLTYSDTAGPAELHLTLGLGITDKVDAAGHELQRGLVMRANGALAVGPVGTGPLTVSLASSGAADWRIPFAQAISLPGQQGSVSITVTWDPRLAAGDPANGVSFTMGRLRLAGSASDVPDGPLWGLTLAVGDPSGTPGVDIAVDLGSVFGELASVVQIAPIEEAYSPSVVLAAGRDPVVDLGHVGG